MVRSLSSIVKKSFSKSIIIIAPKKLTAELEKLENDEALARCLRKITCGSYSVVFSFLKNILNFLLAKRYPIFFPTKILKF